MTRDDIIRMAREAGCVEASHPFNPWSVSQEALERFAALVIAAENEACAQLCERMAKRTEDIRRAALEMAAENIRERRLLA